MGSSWKLDSLVVENFRSIGGRWEIPLDADIVLIHGPNGAGKTSLLSALELGATGSVGFLEGSAQQSGSLLINRNYPIGRVELGLRDGSATRRGSVEFDAKGRTAEAALSHAERADFLERCFLAQTVLGRLLESYAALDQGDTALIRFVKKLAGIDELDSLIEGLHPAGHVARTRTLSRAWSELEDSIDGLKTTQSQSARAIDRTQQEVDRAIQELKDLAAGLPFGAARPDDLIESIRRLLRDLESSPNELEITQGRLVRLAGILSSVATSELVESDDRETLAAQALEFQSEFVRWEDDEGVRALSALNRIREKLDMTEVSSAALFDSFSETKRRVGALAAQERDAAMLRQENEQKRAVLKAQLDAVSAETALADQAVAAISIPSDVRALIDLMTAAAQFVSTDECPICDQSFPSGASGLRHHIDLKVAGLSAEAERYAELSEVATQLRERRSELQSRLDALPPTSGEETGISLSTELVRELNAIQSQIDRGSALLLTIESSQARLADISNRRATINAAEDALNSLLAETNAARPPGTILDAARTFEIELRRSQQTLNFRNSQATRLRTALERLEGAQRDLEAAREEYGHLEDDLRSRQSRLRAAKQRKDAANQLRLEAERTRSSLINDVFDTALNQSWAELFTRLVPTEPFVPQFRKQHRDSRAIDVTLETVLPNGQKSGAPSSVLSFGNANTAALSLFLALHVSAPTAVNWLIFDDPVQSMDDIHVANFAAVIRQLTLAHDRQVVIAVHQRELFDYLAFELAPADYDDRLLKIELSRPGDVTHLQWERVRFAGDDLIATRDAVESA